MPNTETKKTLVDFLPKGEDQEDDEALLATLIGEDGKLKVDDSLPPEYELELMAGQMLEHIAAYKQARQNMRSARNAGNHSQAESFLKQMNFNRTTAAIIQSEFPKAKAIADEIARIRVKQMQTQRLQALANEE